MELLAVWLPWLLGGLVLLIVLAALHRPLERLLGLLARTGVGLGVLMVLGQAGGFLGIHLGVNLFNALVLGLLGAPGFGLLLMLNWTLAGL